MVKSTLKRMLPKPYLMRYWRVRNWFRNNYCLMRHNPVLVYQMGKVGSTSVYESLVACGVAAVHFHWMEPVYMRQIAKKERVEIITLVREPIGRCISEFFQNFELHTGADYHQDAFDMPTLCELFLSNQYFWRPLPWFDEEMKPRLGVDVYDYPFPQERGWLVIGTGIYRLLILKAELDDTTKETIIADFLKLGSFELVRANTAQEKAYADTYRAFIRNIRLPETYVEAMCNAKYTRHFYGETEIAAMRSKWLEKDQRCVALP
jgi:hypothetical protein